MFMVIFAGIVTVDRVSALPEVVSAVTVSHTVDGTGRRQRSTGSRRRLATPVRDFTVHPEVLAAVKAALRAGERWVALHPEAVRTVYR